MNVRFKAKAISAVSLLGTDVFTQLQKEHCVAEHQKMVAV